MKMLIHATSNAWHANTQYYKVTVTSQLYIAVLLSNALVMSLFALHYLSLELSASVDI